MKDLLVFFVYDEDYGMIILFEFFYLYSLDLFDFFLCLDEYLYIIILNEIIF